MGGFDWKGVPTQVLRAPIQRYFYWMLNTSPIDRHLAWQDTDWEKISHKDLALFYYCLFNLPDVFAMACIFSWKQLEIQDMEQRLTRGGLYKIEPL